MSVFDHLDAVPAAPTWRCPHCRTLQPETSRCWACARSTVACATCSLYRVSVASDLGFCADDKSRTPLHGDEVRWCWTVGGLSLDEAPSLFSELQPPGPSSQDDLVTDEVAAGPPPAPAPSRHEPAAEEPTTAGPGGLIDAPHVAPGKRLMSEARRRSQQNGSS